jgi:hypothetical protein
MSRCRSVRKRRFVNGHDILEIAGLTIGIDCEDETIQWGWDPPFTRFLVDAGAVPAIDLQLTIRVDERPSPAGELIFDSGAVWRMFKSSDGYSIECRSSAFEAPCYKTASFDDGFTRGTVAISPELLALGRNPLDYPLDEVIVSNLLGRNRGVELHSCGIIDEKGRGHLFVGVSGAGKTTTARLWEGRASGIVSDDRVIVREQDGVMRMFGTPWHGEAELSSQASAPIAGVYLLSQATSNEMRKLSDSTSVARLLACAFPLFYHPPAMDFTLGFLERLASLVPVRELRFLPDPSVVDLVLEEAA